MTQIVIHARGPQGCGKTTAIRAILTALRQIGMLDEDTIRVNEEGYDSANNESVEAVVFNTPPAEVLRASLDAISVRRGIFGEIDAERRYQTDKWGVAADDTKNTPWMWVSYITQYATKWMTGLFHVPTGSVELFRTSMIKVASIAIAAVESLDRQRAAHGRAFYEKDED